SQQRGEHSVGGGDHLRRRLIGLLETHQVGGLLVQVHARDALLRSVGLVIDGCLRGLLVVGYGAGTADLAHQLAVGTAHAGDAAVEHTQVGHLAQHQRVSVVALRVAVWRQGEAVAVLGRAAELQVPAVGVDRLPRRVGLYGATVHRVRGGGGELHDSTAERAAIEAGAGRGGTGVVDAVADRQRRGGGNLV